MKTRDAKRPTATNIGRNDACPCGSGRKFKHCCMGKPSISRAGFRGGLLWKGSVLLIVLIGLIALAVDMGSGRDAGAFDPGSAPPTAPSTTPAAALPFGSTPAPWFYDTVNNQHWHPDHAHWHSGPPPSTTPAVALPSDLTPAPWFYDTVNNQHWHPGHAHWHSGPPPPPSNRPN